MSLVGFLMSLLRLLIPSSEDFLLSEGGLRGYVAFLRLRSKENTLIIPLSRMKSPPPPPWCLFWKCTVPYSVKKGLSSCRFGNLGFSLQLCRSSLFSLSLGTPVCSSQHNPWAVMFANFMIKNLLVMTSSSASSLERFIMGSFQTSNCKSLRILPNVFADPLWSHWPIKTDLLKRTEALSYLLLCHTQTGRSF